MDLIKGNLLFFIAICSGTAFVLCWQHFDRSCFRKAFIYSRKANQRYEYFLISKITAGISLVAFTLYCVMGYWLKINNSSWFQLFLKLMFIILVVLATAFMGTTKGTVGKNLIVAGILLFGLFGIPLLAVFAVVALNMQLDNYVNVYCIVLLIVNVLLAYASLKDWKKGDIV
ncbi:MAG: hypothetical protein IJB96_05995 [Lachnospira sp.]|nr:hypothetical protein [Lachnospira sp.]